MDRVKLLMKGYQRLDEGKRVEIRPCTMIFTPDQPTASPEEHWRRSIVLEAPEGAILEFDQPFELGRAKVGELEKGRLNGRIRIRSGGKSPGPEDDLEVIAHDVDLMLAGHLHGGQIRLPWIGPILSPSRQGVRYASGVFQSPPTTLHVSRGLSGELPIRLNCPPEVTELVLHGPASSGQQAAGSRQLS